MMPGATYHDRLLLYLDLLGFREMVKKGQADRVRHILSVALQRALDQADKRSAKLGSLVQVIYFSDTILLYPRTAGFRIDTFKQLRFAANAMCRALWSEKIPVSGAMTFGSFVVGPVDGRPEPVYFGQALIDAYDCEKQEKWLGVLVCPSVTARLGEVQTDLGIKRGQWAIRKTGSDCHLLLNPFQAITVAYQSKSVVTAINQIKLYDRQSFTALQFIHYTSEEQACNGNFSSNTAVRYHATAAFAKSVLGADCYQWAVALRAGTNRAVAAKGMALGRTKA